MEFRPVGLDKQGQGSEIWAEGASKPSSCTWRSR